MQFVERCIIIGENEYFRVKFAGNVSLTTEGVTLSGAASRRGLQTDGTLENPTGVGAEGAKRVPLISQAKGQRHIYPSRKGRIMAVFLLRIASRRFVFILYFIFSEA